MRNTGCCVEQPVCTEVQVVCDIQHSLAWYHSLVNAMSTVRSNNGAAIGLRVFLNDIANISVLHSRPNCEDTHTDICTVDLGPKFRD